MLSFQKIPHQSIDGQQKFRFVANAEGEQANNLTGFYVEASRSGVEVFGKLDITKFTDLQPFAKAIADAWKEHQRLLPKITKTLSGH